MKCCVCLCFVPAACVNLFVCLHVDIPVKLYPVGVFFVSVSFSSVALVNIYAALVYVRAQLVDLIASLATNNRV